MDVSALREVESSVTPSAAAASARRQEGGAPQRRSERHDAPLPDRAPAARPVQPRHIDPSEGVAEQATASYEIARQARSAGRGPERGASAEELYIPGWVRITYASRARRGWFLPAPTTLAGYGEEEQAVQNSSEQASE